MQDDQDNAAADTDPLANMKSPSDFAGQKLFIQGDDWHNNAMLGWTHFPWDIYAAGYKDAADALVWALTERKASLDSVVYPLVFLYRQGLELQLKLILPLARRLADKEAAADHQHGLMPLWNELRRHLQQLDPRENDKELSALEDFIRQLDTVDPGSFAFRYPTTKKPETAIALVQCTATAPAGDTTESSFDFAVTTTDLSWPGWICEPLWQDTLGVAVAKHSHLLAHREVPCQEVLGQPIICVPSTPEEPWQAMAQRLIESAGCAHEETVATFDMAMTLVAAGYGIAIAPASRLASYQCRGVSMRPLADAPPIVIAYLLRPVAQLTEPQERFAQRARSIT